VGGGAHGAAHLEACLRECHDLLRTRSPLNALELNDYTRA
jgi:hypothetical protein